MRGCEHERAHAILVLKAVLAASEQSDDVRMPVFSREHEPGVSIVVYGSGHFTNKFLDNNDVSVSAGREPAFLRQFVSFHWHRTTQFVAGLGVRVFGCVHYLLLGYSIGW